MKHWTDAEAAGADAFLAKPLDLRRLLAWLRGPLPAAVNQRGATAL